MFNQKSQRNQPFVFVSFRALFVRIAFLIIDNARIRKSLVRYVSALILLGALTGQVFLVGPVQRASARAVLPVAAPVSAPPALFTTGTSAPVTESLVSGVSSLFAFVASGAKKESAKTNHKAPLSPPPPSASQADLAALRLSPKNATGGTNLYSQNFSWGTSLVNLPGRSGLNAAFGMGYNSLVWLKDPIHSEIDYDPDLSNVAPGFRMGFPVIETVYTSSQTGLASYLMVTPDGRRTEFRYVTTNTYESADSTYTRLYERTGSPVPLDVISTDGTTMHYQLIGGSYQCTQILDRNGNYITIAYDSNNLLQTVTDALGRVVTVNRDSYGNPTTITQTWKDTNGSGSNVTHTWATLSYTTATVSTSFSGLTVVGPANDATVTVLDKVTYPDGSFTKFEYNGYIQVKKISNVAADSTSHILNYVSTNLDSPSSGQTDCPRFTQT